MIPAGPVWVAGVLLVLGGTAVLLVLGWGWAGGVMIGLGLAAMWRAEVDGPPGFLTRGRKP